MNVVYSRLVPNLHLLAKTVITNIGYGFIKRVIIRDKTYPKQV